jgi:hypothetical protein
MRTIAALLTGAERIARELGEAEPGAEHLLLSALELPDGSGARAAAAAGIDAAGLRAALVDEQAAALAAVGVPREQAEALAVPQPIGEAGRPILYAAAPAARELFRAAGDRARAERRRLVGAHVVAAACDLERGTLARALDRIGVDRALLRRTAARELDPD